MNELEFVTQTRRKLHELAELSLQEFKTTEAICHYLDEWGIKYIRPLETGVVAYINGDESTTEYTGFRADIDALPIDEENNINYKSLNENTMHACGHDGHTTALLLFAKRVQTLTQNKDLTKNVLFLFQPAEETIGGANLLIKSGVFNQFNVQRIYGSHLLPTLPEGKVLYKDNEITASATEYRIYLNGKSAHVAEKETGQSAIEALNSIMTQIPMIVHYHLNGLHQNIVHIGKIKAGEAINTVAQEGYLEGTIRTYDMANLSIIKSALKNIVKSVELLNGVKGEVVFSEGYPPTMNNPELKDSVEQAIEQSELDLVEVEKPFLFGEDFSFYQSVASSYFVFFGTQNKEKGLTSGLHTPTFNFDERVLIKVADYYENILNQV